MTRRIIEYFTLEKNKKIFSACTYYSRIGKVSKYWKKVSQLSIYWLLRNIKQWQRRCWSIDRRCHEG